MFREERRQEQEYEQIALEFNGVQRWLKGVSIGASSSGDAGPGSEFGEGVGGKSLGGAK